MQRTRMDILNSCFASDGWRDIIEPAIDAEIDDAKEMLLDATADIERARGYILGLRWLRNFRQIEETNAANQEEESNA